MQDIKTGCFGSDRHYSRQSLHSHCQGVTKNRPLSHPLSHLILIWIWKWMTDRAFIFLRYQQGGEYVSLVFSF